MGLHYFCLITELQAKYKINSLIDRKLYYQTSDKIFIKFLVVKKSVSNSNIMLPINNEKALDKNRLLLAIGNSRIHWAWFEGDCLIKMWNTLHSNRINNNYIYQNILSNKIAKQNLTDVPIFIASVVPQQEKLWKNYPNSYVIMLKDLKLKNIYPTMGIDRALAVWGGGENYGYPCLVIDGGTALTFTGVDRQKKLVGGAILPGLGTQFLTLNQKTAALPKVELPTTLPPRWASDTKGAIASGIIYTIVAGIYSYILDWQQKYPNSQIIFTGGDGEVLAQYLQQQYPDLKSAVKCDRNLIFYGMNQMFD